MGSEFRDSKSGQLFLKILVLYGYETKMDLGVGWSSYRVLGFS